MAILVQSNKKPSVSYPEQTGSIVTFNSQYAGLPLKAHKVAISSQSGVSAINIGSDAKYAGFINFNQISPVKSAIDTNLGITAVQSTDGTVILNGTTEGNYFFNCSSAISIPVGHKVFLCGCPTEGSYSTFYGKDGYTSSAYDVGEGAMIISKNVIMYQILAKKGVTLDNVVFKPQIFDLTVMFGEGNEPKTIEEFRALFSNDYYSYNSGELSTVSAINGSTNSFFTIPIGQTVNEATYNARTGVLEVTQPSVQTLQLPPCPIDTLEGVNNIWADTGDTTVQYIKIGG